MRYNNLEVEVAPGTWKQIPVMANDLVVSAVNEDWGSEIIRVRKHYCSPIPFPTTPEDVRFMTGHPK